VGGKLAKIDCHPVKLLPALIEPRVTGYVDHLYVSTPDTHQAD